MGILGRDYGDGRMDMGAWRREHGEGRMGKGAWDGTSEMEA